MRGQLENALKNEGSLQQQLERRCPLNPLRLPLRRADLARAGDHKYEPALLPLQLRKGTPARPAGCQGSSPPSPRPRRAPVAAAPLRRLTYPPIPPPRASQPQADFMKLPAADGEFDAVYEIEATCHAPDIRGVYACATPPARSGTASRAVYRGPAPLRRPPKARGGAPVKQGVGLFSPPSPFGDRTLFSPALTLLTRPPCLCRPPGSPQRDLPGSQEGWAVCVVRVGTHGQVPAKQRGADSGQLSANQPPPPADGLWFRAKTGTGLLPLQRIPRITSP